MTTFLSKKNNATSKVADVAGIDATTNPVTFNVTTGEGTKFSASNFEVTIGNEIMLCSRTGDALTCTRAQASTSMEAHPQNSTVEQTITAEQMAEYETLSKMQGMSYAADAGSTDDYAVTLAPTPAAYFTGMMVIFKANTANTGACTLNVNSLGAKAIKKNYNADLADNDILANQVVVVVYDGTNFQLVSVIPVTGITASSTDTLTNKRITRRITTITSHATPTINTDNCDAVTITAQAEAITSMTTNLSGTPTNFQSLIIRIKDNGTARAITWGTGFEAKGVALPTTTVISKVLTIGFLYDTVTSKWGCVAVANEA